MKRGREEELTESEGEQEEQEERPTKKSNVFRSPDKISDERRRSRRSREASVSERQRTRSSSRKSSGASEQEEQEMEQVPPPSSPVEERRSVVGILVASPNEVLGTPVRKTVERRVLGEKDIACERELQKKRLNKMLNIFPDHKEAAKKAEEAAAAKEAAAPAAVSKAGGFPFTIGEKLDTPTTTTTSASGGGFAFTLGAKVAAAATSVAPASTSATASATITIPATKPAMYCLSLDSCDTTRESCARPDPGGGTSV